MLTITTPALLFPGISLIMLAYTNRFLALSSLVRSLHAKYLENEGSGILQGQIENLRYRLKLIKNMQAYGALSFIACIVSMFCIYMEWALPSEVFFALSLLFFSVSLILSLIEIQHSTRALELQLGNMEKTTLLGTIKKKLEKDPSKKSNT